MSAITKAVGWLGFVPSRHAARRNDFLAGSLLYSIGDVLICIRLPPTHIMLGLIPIPLKRGFSAFPCGIIFIGPPSWIFVLVHNFVCFMFYFQLNRSGSCYGVLWGVTLPKNCMKIGKVKIAKTAKTAVVGISHERNGQCDLARLAGG